MIKTWTPPCKLVICWLPRVITTKTDMWRHGKHLKYKHVDKTRGLHKHWLNDHAHETCPLHSAESVADLEPSMQMVAEHARSYTKQSRCGFNQTMDWSIWMTCWLLSGSRMPWRPRILPDLGSQTINQPLDFLPTVMGDLRFLPARLSGACSHLTFRRRHPSPTNVVFLDRLDGGKWEERHKAS